MPKRFLRDVALRMDRTVVSRAARGTVASLLAYFFAAQMHLDGPYWAAMTVWIVAQPSRGLLLGKSLARIAGTLVGVTAALPLGWLAMQQQSLFVLVLALWVGCCAAIANTLSGFKVYVAVLAGFTASLIAISLLHHPHRFNELVVSRVACVVIGIFASTLVTWIWTPESELGVLRTRVRQTVQEACHWMGHVLGGRCDPKALADIQARLSIDMATVEAQCAQSSGVRIVRAERQEVRHLLTCIFDALCAADALPQPLTTPCVFNPSPPTPSAILQVMTPDWCRSVGIGNAARLSQALADLSAATIALGRNRLTPIDMKRNHVSLHIDWQHAIREGGRTTVLLLALGLGWLATGSELLLGGLMGASILCSIFSTLESGQQATIGALKGTIAGTLGAAICIFALLPHAHTLPQVVLALAPFTFAGGMVMSNKHWSAMAMDFNMVFLLLTGPAIGATNATPQSLKILGGPVLGAIATALAFQFVLPSSPALRLKDLFAAIGNDVRRVCLKPEGINRRRWNARLLHRGLRMVILAGRSGQHPERAFDLAIKTVNVGFSVLRLRAAASDLIVDSLARAVLELQLSQIAKSAEFWDEQIPLTERPDSIILVSVDSEAKSALEEFHHSLQQLAQIRRKS